MQFSPIILTKLLMSGKIKAGFTVAGLSRKFCFLVLIFQVVMDGLIFSCSNAGLN